MKKILLGTCAIVAILIAVVVHVRINASKIDLPQALMANIEALTSEFPYHDYCRNCSYSLYYDCLITFSDGHVERCTYKYA